MTEISLPWGGTVTGDAGPYSDDDWSDVWRKWFVQDRTLQGVIRDYANELLVSGVTSPLDVDTGAAIVDGKFYENDAATTIAIPTPSVSTRIDLVVLEKDFAAQTVRITRVAGTEGAGAPSLTQTDGTTWQIPIAQASITTGGVITVTDARNWVYSPLSLTYADKPIRYVSGMPFSFYYGVACDAADGVDFLHIPAELDGWNLVSVWQGVEPASGAPSGGPVTMEVYNLTDAQQMLSTESTIDDGETSSDTAAAPAVIDTAHDDVAEGDIIQINLTSVNGALGHMWELGFQEP